MQIRPLVASDAAGLWALRLRALETDPEAFGESAEEHRQVSIEAYAERFRGGGDHFVLGAFQEEQLAGMAGFYREVRLKRRHTGRVWGVFVAPECRGRGIASALIAELLRRARAISGLRIVLLTVVTTQEPARRLYRTAGFRAYGLRPQAVAAGGRFLDEELMFLKI